jgi:hypothetical protein
MRLRGPTRWNPEYLRHLKQRCFQVASCPYILTHPRRSAGLIIFQRYSAYMIRSSQQYHSNTISQLNHVPKAVHRILDAHQHQRQQHRTSRQAASDHRSRQLTRTHRQNRVLRMSTRSSAHSIPPTALLSNHQPRLPARPSQTFLWWRRPLRDSRERCSQRV